MGIAASPATIQPEAGARTVEVFVSHKHTDFSTATEIKERFEEIGGKRMEVHLSEFIPRGEKWDPVIHEWLRQSDWLLLLYTGCPAQWDWCLYETGFFAGTHEPTTRLVCLHRKGVDPPKPLEKWQGVTEAECQQLLSEIFRQPPRQGEEPVNPKVTDRTLKEVADCIMAAFVDKGTSTEFTPHVEISLDAGEKQELLNSRRLPGGITVSADAKAREIFGLTEFMTDESLHWSDITAQLEESRQGGWASVLSNSIRRLCEKRGFSTTLPVLYSPAGELKQRWRPILQSAQMGGSREEFKVVFSEILPEDDPRPADPLLDYCMTLMKLSRLIRFGIIEPYGSKLRRFQRRKSLGEPIKQQELEDELGSLPFAIDRIEIEGRNSSLNKPEDTTERIFDPQTITQYYKWMKEWIEYRRQAVKAVGEWNLDSLAEALDGMRTVNRESFRLVARKYCDLIDQLR